MRTSDIFKKAASVFVQFDDAGQPPSQSMSDEEFQKLMAQPASAGATAPGPLKTTEQMIKDAPGPNLDQISVAAPAKPQEQPLRADGTVDYGAIYSMAGLQDEAFTAEQLLDLLATLPPELPLEARRQTVKITIQAMAKTVPVTPQSILTDAMRKLKALASYEEGFGKQADEFVVKTETEIKALEAQIATKRASIEDAKAKKTKMETACKGEADRLDDVVEFFSLDVPPSKYAAPQ